MQTSVPNPDTIVYFDNRFTSLGEANVNILTHALNYGTGVFEGVRGYWSDPLKDLLLVRAEDHYRRWKLNCRLLGIEPQLTAFELAEITHQLVRENHYETDIYVRPLAYMSSARIGVAPDGVSSFAIVAVPFGVYLDSNKGLHAGVVTWRRLEDTAIPCRAKICGAYVNSVLATSEARMHGYDEAILLNEAGHVAEGSTCNVFLVRGGRLITPSVSENILEGLTRASIIELARHEMHMEVIERPVDRSELYSAEEIFFTGTAVEIAPVVKVDRIAIADGRVGPFTCELRRLYHEATRGLLPEYQSWLTHTYVNASQMPVPGPQYRSV
jgi:branched-chain amino acid aminotransferase